MENKNQNKLFIIVPIVLLAIIISISIYLLSQFKSFELPDVTKILNSLKDKYSTQQVKDYVSINGNTYYGEDAQKIRELDKELAKVFEDEVQADNIIHNFADFENELNRLQELIHINCIQLSKNEIVIIDDNKNINSLEFKFDLPIDIELDNIQNYLEQNPKYDYLYKFISENYVMYLDKSSIKELKCDYIDYSDYQYLDIFTTTFDFSVKMSNEEYNKLKSANDFIINEKPSTLG